MTHPHNIPGFIIAGGKSDRMGGIPKGLLALGDRPILTRVLDRFSPQVTSISINSNLPAAKFQEFGVPVFADRGPADAGPLSGLLSCLCYAAEMRTDSEWIATVPWDCPFVPLDLIDRLASAAVNADAAIAISGDHQHPLAALWRRALLPKLTQTFDSHGVRSMKGWLTHINAAQVPFSAEPIDPFFNINTPDDLARAEELAKNLGIDGKGEENGTASPN